MSRGTINTRHTELRPAFSHALSVISGFIVCLTLTECIHVLMHRAAPLEDETKQLHIDIENGVGNFPKLSNGCVAWSQPLSTQWSWRDSEEDASFLAAK
jgi:hypothetical protein